jgi:hypothetical protein
MVGQSRPGGKSQPVLSTTCGPLSRFGWLRRGLHEGLRSSLQDAIERHNRSSRPTGSSDLREGPRRLSGIGFNAMSSNILPMQESKRDKLLHCSHPCCRGSRRVRSIASRTSATCRPSRDWIVCVQAYEKIRVYLEVTAMKDRKLPSLQGQRGEADHARARI